MTTRWCFVSSPAATGSFVSSPAATGSGCRKRPAVGGPRCLLTGYQRTLHHSAMLP
jgi:hypothetical protein